MKKEEEREDGFLIATFKIAKMLDLSGNDWIVYSFIKGFNDSTHKPYEGSQGYIADCINVSRQTVNVILQNLTDRGLLIRKEIRVRNQNLPTYEVNRDVLIGCQESLQGVKKLDRGCQESLQGGCQETLHNNIAIDNNNNNIERGSLSNLGEEKSHEQSECGRREKPTASKKEKSSAKRERGEVPTLQEVQDLARERNYTFSPKSFFIFYEEKNWKGVNDWELKAELWQSRESTNGERKPLKSAENRERKVDKEYQDYLKSIGATI